MIVVMKIKHLSQHDDTYHFRMAVPKDCVEAFGKKGIHESLKTEDFGTATAAMTRVSEVVYKPIPEHQAVYDRHFALYRALHDLFGTRGFAENQFEVMKELIAIREEARG